MGDEHHRAGIVAEKRFEPRDRVDVEMVRGLVEQEDVRLGHERAREQDAPLPSAGQGLDECVGRQRQMREHRVDPLLEPPAVLFVELMLQPSERVELPHRSRDPPPRSRRDDRR